MTEQLGKGVSTSAEMQDEATRGIIKPASACILSAARILLLSMSVNEKLRATR